MEKECSLRIPRRYRNAARFQCRHFAVQIFGAAVQHTSIHVEISNCQTGALHSQSRVGIYDKECFAARTKRFIITFDAHRHRIGTDRSQSGHIAGTDGIRHSSGSRSETSARSSLGTCRKGKSEEDKTHDYRFHSTTGLSDGNGAIRTAPSLPSGRSDASTPTRKRYENQRRNESLADAR